MNSVAELPATPITTVGPESALLLPETPIAPLSGLAVDARQLDERIYDALREKILLRELPPSSRLSIRALADHLGVSVTPVRDALRRPLTDGLVQTRCRCESTFTRLAPQYVDDIFGRLLARERHAAERAACRNTDSHLTQLAQLDSAMRRTFKGERYLYYPELIRLDGE